MTMYAHISIDAEPDVQRKAWRVYLAGDESERGDLVATLDPDAEFAAVPVEEGDHAFRVVAAWDDGTAEDWKKSGGRKTITVTGEEHVPTAITAAGGGRLADGQWGVIADPPAAGDPPQMIQLVRGTSEYQGQLVGEAPLEVGGLEGRRRSGPISPSEPGRGTGEGNVTLHVRSVTEDGYAPCTAVTFVSPHLDFPNMTSTVLGYVTPNTLSGFSNPALTAGWTHSATHGLLFKELPTGATATTTNGWGTYETDGTASALGDEPFGSFYVTAQTITSQEMDLGSSESFVLELYDEFERASAQGKLDTLPTRDMDYPHNPTGSNGWNKKSAGPVWLGRQVREDGRPLRPVKPVRWQFRYGTSSPVTGNVWRDYPAPVWLTARYAQVRCFAEDPIGCHQLRAQRVYIRAWQANNSLVKQQSGDFNTSQLEDITSSTTKMIGVETGAPKIQVNIGGTVYTTTTLASV